MIISIKTKLRENWLDTVRHLGSNGRVFTIFNLNSFIFNIGVSDIIDSISNFKDKDKFKRPILAIVRCI